MGTNLACLQVYTGGKQKPEIRRAVINAIRQQILNEGYLEIPPPERELYSDRELFVGPVGDSSWLTVFLTNSDLREIAQNVSRNIKGTVIVLSLLDSDIVHLRRYDNGQVADEYCNAPHLYNLYVIEPDSLSDWDGIEENDLKALTRGDVVRWHDLFVEGVNPDDIQEIWDSDPVFADDILWATVDAFGMNDEEIISDFFLGQGREKFTRLAFQLKEKPPYEIKVEGLPKLTLASYVAIKEVYLDQQVDLRIWVQNNGGAFIGLDILVWGSALDKEIVHLSKAEVLSVNAMELTEAFTFAHALGKLEEQEISMLMAHRPTLEFPQGVAGGLEIGSAGNLQKIMEVITQTQVQFYFPVSIKATGSGELFIAFVPHTNRENGRAVYQASLKSIPSPRQPMPSKEMSRRVHPSTLQLLETPDSLFGLISLGTNQEQSAEIVANAIEDWVATIVSANSGDFVTYLRPTLNLKPKKKRLAAADTPSSSHWEKLREDLSNCVSFSIHHKVAGVVYDVSALSFQVSGEEPAPQLLFYYAPGEVNEKRLPDAKKWLLEMMERLIVDTDGLQAMVGQWGWRGTPMSLHMTFYEEACQLGGQCTTARFWCQRFLRGVTPHLWLGPDLLAHLGDRERLESVSTVTSYGSGVRVTLNEGATLDELEVALDSLLARETDWRIGMGRLYSRTKR